MRAKASIPAWAKLTIGGIAIAATVALLVAAPWRGARDQQCGVLTENVEQVAATGIRRASGVYRADLGLRRQETEIRIEPGDFSGAWTVGELRACLGSGWSETHDSAQAASRGDVWVFVRAGGPIVIYTQSYRAAPDEHALQAQIAIEPLVVSP